jgi:hypothetical protein
MNITPSLRHRLAVLGVASICGATLLAHFGLTVLYLTPLNPVRLIYGKYAEAYMQPFFKQRWSLFAPNPPLDNRSIALRCRVADPAGVRETDWIELDQMVIKVRRKNLFSPVERLGRVNRVILSSALGTRNEMVALFKEKIARKLPGQPNGEAFADDEKLDLYQNVAESIAAEEQRVREATRPFIDRVGSSYCEAFFGSGRVLASQFLIVNHRFPRYSERAQPDDHGEKKAFTLTWGEFVPDVADLHL